MSINHPLALNQKYSVQDNGTVRVETGNEWGIFDADGRWLKGSLKSCDPQMCRWLASEVIMNKFTESQAAQQ